MEIQAEIEYRRQDGTWVHSDIEPKGCQFESIDAKHRDFLHRCLDEWLDKSGGSGAFYIKDADFAISEKDALYPGMLRIVYSSAGHVVSDGNVEAWALELVNTFNGGGRGLVANVGTAAMVYQIRVLVKKRFLKPEDVCFFFPETGEYDAEFVDENGKLTYYPPTKYEELLEELSGIGP